MKPLKNIINERIRITIFVEMLLFIGTNISLITLIIFTLGGEISLGLSFLMKCFPILQVFCSDRPT